MMLDLPGVAVNDHHAGCSSFDERTAGNKFLGEVVIEVGGLEHMGFLSSKFKMPNSKLPVSRQGVGIWKLVFGV